MDALGAAEFAALMSALGPFERRPMLAVAVSGGADSMALALLAGAWAQARGGAARALIVDHGLRAEAAGEAELTRQRMEQRGIAARVLRLAGLGRGPSLAARARAARYAALEAECAAAGILHLLLAHHAADQAETVAMRLLAGSGPAGLAAMPALAETSNVRLLRPLLAIPPGRLRATLVAAGEAWVEDPSNHDQAAQRPRLRALRRDRDGSGPATRAAVVAATARGRARALQERATAASLARRVTMAPEGFAVVAPGAVTVETLAALVRTLGGRCWTPALRQIRGLSEKLHPATLGGVRILPAGRLYPGGWLLVREASAIAPAQAVQTDTDWDRRFRLNWTAPPAAKAELGALAGDAKLFRNKSDLPAAVLGTLPSVRLFGKLVAAPHLGYAADWGTALRRAVFVPTVVLAAAPILPALVDGGSACSGQQCNPDTSVGMRHQRGHPILQ